jgi:predicted ATPase
MKLELPYMLALLAETYERAGQLEAALHTLEEALHVAHTTGENYYRPELHRLHATFLLAAGEVDAAQASFQQALTTAQAQQTKSLELRTAMDLSRLWAEQGRRAEAYARLEGIYAWFTEGFDTADLRQAQELLLALAP